jgi:hypothetical protein
MSVEQEEVIDIISVDKKSGHVLLTVSDHLDWSDTIRHQTILQKKFNAYLAFLESGEISDKYPNAKNLPVDINVVFRFKPDTEGLKFLARAREVIEKAGFGFRHEMFADSYDN